MKLKDIGVLDSVLLLVSILVSFVFAYERNFEASTPWIVISYLLYINLSLRHKLKNNNLEKDK